MKIDGHLIIVRVHMERDYAVSLCDDYGLFPKLIDVVRDSHADYVNNVAADIRARQDSAARAHFIHRNALFHLLTRIGETGPVRLKEYRRLKYLYVDGDPLAAACRVKKVGRHSLLSRTYPTPQQGGMQDAGQLLFDNAFPYHLIVGFTEVGDDVNPQLERIVLTKEVNCHVAWWHLLWRSDSQSTPIETGYDQPVFPQYSLKPKKVQPAEREGEKNQKKPKAQDGRG